jgi:hypothetical protein
LNLLLKLVPEKVSYLTYILTILLVKLKKKWRESWVMLQNQQGTQMWRSMAPKNAPVQKELGKGVERRRWRLRLRRLRKLQI